MNQHKPTRRILAWILSIGMALGMTPLTAKAETMPPGASGEIIAFEALSEETTNREAALGASWEDLNLPETLTVTVLIAAETDLDDTEEPAQDSGEPEPEEEPRPDPAPDEGGENPDVPPQAHRN
jgi:hypothetical protein